LRQLVAGRPASEWNVVALAELAEDFLAGLQWLIRSWLHLNKALDLPSLRMM
jgi:hypothetical protein